MRYDSIIFCRWKRLQLYFWNHEGQKFYKLTPAFSPRRCLGLPGFDVCASASVLSLFSSVKVEKTSLCLIEEHGSLRCFFRTNPSRALISPNEPHINNLHGYNDLGEIKSPALLPKLWILQAFYESTPIFSSRWGWGLPCFYACIFASVLLLFLSLEVVNLSFQK